MCDAKSERVAKVARWHKLAVIVLVFALLALISTGVAVGVKIPIPNMRFNPSGGISPRALPEHQLAPIALHLNGEISTADGTQPPPLQTVIADFDRNGALDTEEIPVCSRRQLIGADERARKACGSATLGSGSARITTAGRSPLSLPLTIFNGGSHSGVTTIYIRASSSAEALVSTVKIKNADQGPYGLQAIASIPKIAGGQGSVVDFNLKFNRRSAVNGKRRSVVAAKCADGQLRARISASFQSGEKLDSTLQRTCSQKG